MMEITPRAVLICAVAALVLSVPASLALGFLIGPAAALMLVGSVFAAARTPALRTGGTFSRRSALLSALMVSCLGGIFLKVLVVNPSDNAYLWIAMVGVMLLAVAAIFALALLVPFTQPMRWLTRAALFLLWAVGGLGALLMLLGGLIPLLSGTPGGTADYAVVIAHIAALLALVGTLWLVGYQWQRGEPSSQSGSSDQ